MSKPIEVRVIYKGYLWVVIIPIAFGLVFLIPLLYILFIKQSLDLMSFIFSLPGILLIGYGIREYKRRSGFARKSLSVYNMLTLKGTELHFSQPLDLEYGWVEVIGLWRLHRRRRSYLAKIVFKPIGSLSGVLKVDIKKLLGDKGFTILIDFEDNGYVRLPALRIANPEYYDTYIAYVNPENISLEPRMIRITTNYANKDIAEAVVKIDSKEIAGVLYRILVNRSKRARLELYGASPYLLQAIRIVLAETNKKQTEFTYKFQPSKPWIIVSHGGLLDPSNIRKAIELKKPVVTGFSFGEYILRLTIEVPFRYDIYSQYTIKKEEQ
ncbi:MAG: hypothetical protein J7K21_05870 [Desulfurococcales archaeon]|nr:hypothetical protein [Desulfurococcales archaeon]